MLKKSDLEKLYLEEMRPIRYISKKLKCNPRTVSKYLKKYNIPIRYGGEAVKTQWINNSERREKTRELARKNIAGKREKTGRLMKCFFCGEAFYAQNNEIEKGKYYCSTACAKADGAYSRKAGSNPHWSGGNKQYRGHDYKMQRNKLKCRENKKCQICGISEDEYGSSFWLYYIIPFNHFGIERHHEANQLNNLAYLCPKCHFRMREETTGIENKTDYKKTFQRICLQF